MVISNLHPVSPSKFTGVTAVEPAPLGLFHTPFTWVKGKGVNTICFKLGIGSAERAISEQKLCLQSPSCLESFKWIKTYEMRGFEKIYNQRDIFNNLFWFLRCLWRVGLDQDLWKYKETISHGTNWCREMQLLVYSLARRRKSFI